MGLAAIHSDDGLRSPRSSTCAGQGKANPVAAILSAAMMLDWLAARHGDAPLAEAATRLERAVDRTFASGRVMPMEPGGSDGTLSIARALAAQL